METPDQAAGEPAGNTTSAPTKPRPTPWLSVERVENGFIIGATFPNDPIGRGQRIAHTPAEAGAAVAELLARHMPAEDLAYAPRLSLVPSRKELLDKIALRDARKEPAKAQAKEPRAAKAFTAKRTPKVATKPATR